MLGDLKGLEIGSLHMERSEDSGDEELAYIPGSPDDDPLFRCLKGEMKQRLVDAIEELPEKERMVLTLYYYEELTFALLEFLLMRRGRCCSRSELLREVWQMSPDAGTNVVDVYVNYLRRKLGAASADGDEGLL